MKSETIGNLAKALAAAQGELADPRKSKVVSMELRSGGRKKYAYSELSDVVQAIRPVFSKHGLSFTHVMGMDSGVLGLACMLLHESGEHITQFVPIPNAGMAPQDMGSWMTYMRRYSLCNMAGICGETDDDAEQAQQEAEQRAIEEKAAQEKKVAEAREKLKAQGKTPLKSAYDGRELAPGESPLPKAAKPEKPAAPDAAPVATPPPAQPAPATAPATATKRAQHIVVLENMLRTDGYTVEEFMRAIGPKDKGGFGHMPAGTEFERLALDYCQKLSPNWAKVTTRMKELRS